MAEQSDAVGAEGCTVGRRAVGRCTLREYDEAVPSAFRYFAAQVLLNASEYCTSSECL